MEEHYIDIFEDYYFDNLTEVEVAEFKKRLDTDSAFKKAFRKYQLTVKLAKLRKPENLIQEQLVGHKKEVSEIPKEKESTKRVPLHRNRFVRIAASIAALFALVFIGLRLLNPPAFDNTQLYTQLDISSINKDVAKGLLEARPIGYADEAKKNFYEGIDYFKSDDFKLAVLALNKYLSQTNIAGQDTAYYYLGESYRLATDFDEALNAFNRIDDQSDLFNKKLMSILLCNLQLEAYEKSKQAAQRIVSSQDTTFNSRAKLLLKRLD